MYKEKGLEKRTEVNGKWEKSEIQHSKQFLKKKTREGFSHCETSVLELTLSGITGRWIK